MHQAEVDAVLDAIAHRGPDGRGAYIHANVGLGHVRLSIIDLSALADQPLHAPDGLFTVVFNGEIYNYRDLRKQLSSDYDFRTESDTEVLLAAYRVWGDECLSHLNGMFSFVIFDKTAQKIFGARDRYGIKPFYYELTENQFSFASEIKGILATHNSKPELNESVLYDFIVFNRTDHREETCFKGINNLRPGHSISLFLKENTARIKQWYFLPELNEIGASCAGISIELRKKLEDSLKLHLVSDVEVGSALSGGIDSSIIVSLMRELSPADTEIHSFSAVYDSRWEKDEKKYVEEVVRQKQLTAHFVTPDAEGLLAELDDLIRQQEEPFASASMYASFCVYREARKHNIKVLLNGQGADELFAYDYMAAFYFYELWKKGRLLKLIKEMRLFHQKQYSSKFTFQLFLFLLAPSFLHNKLIKASNPAIKTSFIKKYGRQSDFYTRFFRGKTLNQNVRKHLEMKIHHLLRVEDKNSMRFGVEGRVPFLEVGLVEYALQIPAGYKVQNGEVKSILKETAKDILPELIYKRNNKIGYETPMDAWMRTSRFEKQLESTIYAEEQPLSDYFELGFIKKAFEEHKTGAKNNSQVLWKFFYLSKWYQMFFK